MRFTAYFTSLCVLLTPLCAAAQQRSAAVDTQRLIISEKAIADALATEQAGANTQRDSVKNGTIIGAVLGAAIMGVGVTYLCNALREPGDPPCWKSSGLAIAIGAGAGALGGAGIDALLTRTSRQPAARQRMQQYRAADKARLIVSEKVIADAVLAEQTAPIKQRDSVKNGAIIGAVIGAVVAAAWSARVCYELRDFGDEDQSCVPGALLMTWLGAAAGGFSGAGIDALLAKDQRRFFVVQLPLKK